MKSNDKIEWHEIDATAQVLGRVASQVAQLLLAKHRVDWTAHQAASVRVVVINTDEVVLTGRKEEQKMYRRYSGYPGGLKERSAAEVRKRDSRQLVHQAVTGMLPKNNLRDARLRNLKLYAGAVHPHAAQVKSWNTTSV